MEHDGAHRTGRDTGIPSGAASNRRRFLERAFLASIGGALGNSSFARELASAGSSSPRFFTTTRRDGRWWFLTPAGEVFWSVGLNHADPATLRYLDSGEVWAEKYGNSMERWLPAVKQDLSSWGFNTLGWNQELVTWNDQNRPHCVGYHLCGAYLRNRVRRYGLKDARDAEDPSTPGLKAANEEMHRWIRQQDANPRNSLP